MNAKPLPVAEKMLAGLWSALWAARCPLCGEPLTQWDAVGFCIECVKTFQAVEDPVCQACGKQMSPASLPSSGLCGDCTLNPPEFDAARAHGKYQGALAMAIKDFKFRRRRFLAPALASLIVEAWSTGFRDDKIDMVMPVPLHPSRIRMRGFNQAADLARPVSRRVPAPLVHDCLVALRPTEEQALLSPAMRRQNVKGAFGLRSTEQVAGKTVLVVDDVLTTGATAGECAKVLNKAGARRVLVLTAARSA